MTCGGPLKRDAKFCTGCGQAVGEVPEAIAADDGYTYVDDEDAHARERQRRRTLAGVAAVTLLLGGAGSYYFLREPSTSVAAAQDPAIANSASDESATAIAGVETEKYIVADANVRNRPTASGTRVLTKLFRGTKVSGIMQVGEDGTSRWFKLANGQGFIGAVNLSDAAPPVLASSMNDADWYAPYEVELRALPDDNSAVIETVQPGTHLIVAGVTQNNFAEMKLNKGGVGYVPGYLVNMSSYPNTAADAATDAADAAADAADAAADAARGW